VNINPIIAVLILKNIITQDEGQAIVDFVHDKPQSTVLADAIESIKPLLLPTEALVPPLGPVGPVQREEEIAARTADVLSPPAPVETAPPAPAEPEKPAEPKADKQPETDKSAKDSSVKKADPSPAKK
jgi:hypothetical protein